MSWQSIKSILKTAKPRQHVTIRGWVKSCRQSKNVGFVVLNDGSQQGDLQVVVDREMDTAFSKLGLCQTGASVMATGQLSESQGKGQNWELLCDSLEVIGTVPADDYPLQKKGHSLEFLREIAHIRARTNTLGASFRIRNALARSIHDFFQQEGFIWAHTPIITANDCEGAGELFHVTSLDLNCPPKTDRGSIDYSQDFFGKPAHLTVSGQLEGEALAQSLGKIYTFGPTFRAENSNTYRHLAEFWMVEPEVAFADLESNCNLVEQFLRHQFKSVLEACHDELDFLGKHFKQSSPEMVRELAEKPFKRITYTEVIELLKKESARFEYPVEWGADLQSEHEKFIAEEVCQGVTIITDYPKDIKAFYMRLNDDGRTVAAMDVVAPRIGEIVGGSQREDRLDVLKARIKEMKIPDEGLEWYFDLRRFGSTPHAGFGLGFERLVQYVTGLQNIRDVIPFPRYPKHVAF